MASRRNMRSKIRKAKGGKAKPVKCGKVVYFSENGVIKALERLKKNVGGRECRYYFCMDCDGWHLTKKAKYIA